MPEKAVRARRQKDGITATFRIVPVSGVEHAEYYYSTYSGAADEVPVNDKKKIMFWLGGPNRIGQASIRLYLRACRLHPARPRV